MFKKILSVVLAVLMIATLVVAAASCGKKNKDDGVFKAALICLHGDNSTYDKNFIDAFKAACEAKGLTADQYTIVTDIDEDEPCYEEAAKFADADYEIVFADSFGHEPYMLKAAKEFSWVEFCHATGTQAHTAGVANYHNAFASIYEGRYLAGVAAGLKLVEIYGETISDADAKIGYVGAHPYAEVVSGYTSFFLGVRSVVPNATMEVRYTGSWYDEKAEKATALALIDNGCKLISQHADSMGAPTACDEKGIPNVAYNGATGKDTFVVASRINWAPYFEYAIDCAMNGKKIDANWTGTMDTNSVLLTDLGTNAAPGTAEKLAAVKAELAAGTRKVFDCATFTVGGKAVTEYLADVDDDGTFTGETNVIKTAGGITYFAESEFRSAPYFDLRIDGITEIN